MRPQWELQVLHALREHTGYALCMTYTYRQQPHEETPVDGAPQQELYHLQEVCGESHTGSTSAEMASSAQLSAGCSYHLVPLKVRSR